MDLLLIIKYSALISFGSFILVIISSYILSKSKNSEPVVENNIDPLEGSGGLTYNGYYGTFNNEKYYQQPTRLYNSQINYTQKPLRKIAKAAHPKYTVIKEL